MNRPSLPVAPDLMWPRTRPDRHTAEPTAAYPPVQLPACGQLDLGPALAWYAGQLPVAVRREGGFRLGDPVRRMR